MNHRRRLGDRIGTGLTGETPLKCFKRSRRRRREMLRAAAFGLEFRSVWGKWGGKRHSRNVAAADSATEFGRTADRLSNIAVYLVSASLAESKDSQPLELLCAQDHLYSSRLPLYLSWERKPPSSAKALALSRELCTAASHTAYSIHQDCRTPHHSRMVSQ
jgi:hypothetical protein